MTTRRSRRRLWRTIAFALLCALLASRNVIIADDTKPPVETPAESKETAPDKDSNDESQSEPDAKLESKPEAEKTKPSLTERLLKEVVGDEAQAAVNPLDAIVERMRSAQQRLQKSETDQETRDLQTRVVKDLDELIEKLKNQKPPPKSNQNNQSPPPPMGDNNQNQPPRGSSQPKPQNSQQQQQQQKGAGSQQKPQTGSSGATQSEKSRDSNANLNKTHTPEEEAARQRMAKDVWGHLPPALRQQLLNVYSEKFLPKYDDLVRKYYEALAEQNRKNP